MREIRYTLGLQEQDPQQEQPDLQETVYGYALRFGEDSVPLYDEKTKRWFVERIDPAAITDQLLSDLLLLYNHRPDAVLASRRAGNLSAYITERGLWFSAQLNATSWARDAYQLVADGTLRGCSFAMVVRRDEWSKEQGYWVRTIREIAAISEVSMVIYPAYPTTTVDGEQRMADAQDLLAYEQEQERRAQEQERLEQERRASDERAAYMQELRTKYLPVTP